MGDRNHQYPGLPPTFNPGSFMNQQGQSQQQQQWQRGMPGPQGAAPSPQMRQHQMDDLMASQQMAQHLTRQNFPQQSFNPQSGMSFHDSQNGLHQGLPPSFPMGIQATQNRNAMLSAAMQHNNPSSSSAPHPMSRQLEMIQNAQANPALGRQFQSQEMFDAAGSVAARGVPGGSPAFPRPGGPQINLPTLYAKGREITEEIKRIDNEMIILGNTRAGVAEPVFLSQHNNLTILRRQRMATLNHIKQLIAKNTPGGVPGAPGSPPNAAQLGPNRLVSSPGQPGISMAPVGLGDQQTTSAQLLAMAASRQNPPNMPMRTGPSPRPGLPSQLPGRASPGGQPPRFAGAIVGIPPLGPEIFETAFKNFVNTRKLVLDTRLLTYENRDIRLHALHTAVMAEGGAIMVDQHDNWTLVGARMGFVQFPGNGTEPARSGPAIAGHLAHIYREYLNVFDQSYINSALMQRSKNAEASKAAAQQQLHNNMAAQPHNLAARAMLQTRIQSTVHLVKHSVPELRAMKVPEDAIAFIESNRNLIQLAADDQAKGNPLHNRALAPKFPPEAPQMLPDHLAPRLTPEQAGHLQELMARIKKEITQTSIPALPFQNVPESERREFGQTLESLLKTCALMEGRMQLYYSCIKSEDMLRRIMSIILTTQHQRNIISQTPPRFILNLMMVRTMHSQMQTAFTTLRDAVNQRQQRMQQQHHMGLNPSGGLPGSIGSPSMMGGAGMTLQPPPERTRRDALGGSPPMNASSPANARTPVTTAPSPSTGAKASPKPKPKPKPVPRATRKPSISKTAPSPAPVMSPPQGIKRQYEDDGQEVGSSYTETMPSPPKRVKTNEWDGPTSEALIKKEEQLESIKTEDDASEFMEQMSELIKLADSQEGTLATEISSVLDQILKGYSAVDNGEGPPSSSSFGAPVMTQPSPPVVDKDEFVEFFDFSSFGEDDTDSKAPTPDLSSALTSTNPSPESQSGLLDHEQHPPLVLRALDAAKVADAGEDLQIGAWKEIDGGESAYYQPDKFQYDGEITTTEQPWAIFPS